MRNLLAEQRIRNMQRDQIELSSTRPLYVQPEDKNPNDCKCGRSWYPRYRDPATRRFDKICPGCHRDIHQCNC